MKRMFPFACALMLACVGRAGVLVPEVELDEKGDAFLDLPSLTQTSAVARALATTGLPPSLDQRIRETRNALALHPNDAAVRARLGRLLLLANRTHEGLQQYWQAARLRPQDPQRVEEFAFALLAAGDHRNGAKLYEALLERNPDSPRTVVNLAAAYYHLARTTDAIALLRKFTTQEPTHLRGWYNLGVCQFTAGQLPQASQSLQRALQLQPGHPYVLAALARVHRAMGREEIFDQTQTMLIERLGAEPAAALLAQEPMPIYLIR